MAQLILTSNGLTKGSSLEQALELLQARLVGWASHADAYNALLLQVFRAQRSDASRALQASINRSGLGISLQILDGATLSGINGCYTSKASDGFEAIYLNATWLQGATPAEIEAVLLEEIGHAIDIRLNGAADSPGDEGEIFAALLRGSSSSSSAFSENDQQPISLNGSMINTELAASSSSTRPTTYFLRIEGIAGLSSESYDGWFPISQPDFDGLRSLDPLKGVPQVDLSRLSVVIEKSSGALPPLYRMISEGKPIRSLQIQGVVLAENPDVGPVVTYDLRANNLFLGAIRNAQDGGNSDPVTLDFSVGSFGIKTASLDSAGKQVAPTAYGYDSFSGKTIPFETLATPASLRGVDDISGYKEDFRFYLRIDGVDGNSIAKGFEGWFDVDWHDFDVLSAISRSSPQFGPGIPKFSPLSIILPRGRAAQTQLYQYLAGAQIKHIQIVGTVAEKIVYELRGSDVTLTAFDAHAGVGYDDANASLQFNLGKFGISTTPLGKDDTLGTPIQYGYDIARNVPISFASLPAPSSAALTDFSFGYSVYYLKIDGITGNSTTAGYEGWFEIDSYDLDVTAGPQFAPLSVDLRPGTPLSSLYQYLAQGNGVNGLKIEGVRFRDGFAPQQFYELRLGGARLTRLDVGNSDVDRSPGDYQLDQLATLEFEFQQIGISTWPFPSTQAGALFNYGYDVLTKQPINVTSFARPLSGASPAFPASFKISYFLRIEGIAGLSSGSYDGWFPISQPDFDGLRSLDPLKGVPQVDLSRLSVVIEKSSGALPLLYRMISEGKPIRSLQIQGVVLAENPDVGPVVTYDLRANNLFLGAIRNAQDGGNSDPVTLDFSVGSFGIKTASLDSAGKTGAPTAYGYDSFSGKTIPFETLATPASLRGVDDISGYKADFRFYLRIDGVAGNSVAKGFEGWFDVDWHDFDVLSAMSSSSPQFAPGIPKFSPLSIILPRGRAAQTQLYQYLAGAQIKHVQIVGTVAEKIVYELRGSDVTLTAFDAHAAAGYDDANASLQFNLGKFGISTTPLGKDNTLGTPFQYGYDIARKVPISYASLPAPSSAALADFSFGYSVYYLKIDGITGNSTTAGYEGWFEIGGYDLDVKTGPQFGPLSVDLRPGASLSSFYQYLAQGNLVNGLRIEGVVFREGLAQKIYELRLGGVRLTRLDVGNSGVDRFPSDHSINQLATLEFEFQQIGISTWPLPSTQAGALFTYGYDLLASRQSPFEDIGLDSLPIISEMTLQGNQLQLQFSESINTTGLQLSRFRISVAGVARSISAINAGYDNSQLLLTLAGAAPTSAETITLTYFDLTTGNDSSGVIQDLRGQDMATTQTARPVDTLSSSANVPTLAATYSNLILTGAASIGSGNAGNNTIRAQPETEIANLLTGGPGIDRIDGAQGSDIYIIASSLDHPAAEIRDNGTSGTDELRFTSVTADETLTVFAADTGLERVTIGTGTAANPDRSSTTPLNVDARAAANGLTITGTAGINRITGSAFADIIAGGGAIDVLDGANGSDIYIIASSLNHPAAEIRDSGSDGIDELRFSSVTADETLTVFAAETGLERVTIGTGTAANPDRSGTTALHVDARAAANGLTITGTAGINRITGSAFADIIAGGGAIDVLDGANGSDIYIIASSLNHPAAEIRDSGTSGSDELRFSSVTAGETLTFFAAETGLERVTIGTGTAANPDRSSTTALHVDARAAANGLTITGTAGINRITGSAFADIIAGGGAIDVLDGANGSDIYIIASSLNHPAAEIRDSGTSGSDELRFSSVTAGETLTVFAAETGLERVTIGTGTAANPDRSGTTALHVDARAAANGLTITGTAGINRITGSAFADIIAGGGAIDALDGANGSDIYIIASSLNHPAAEIRDSGTSGSDELRFSSVTAGETLTVFAAETGLERVMIGTGTAANPDRISTTPLNVDARAAANGLTINGNAGINKITGSSFADQISANEGNDLISGGLGYDILTGGSGADTFRFDTTPNVNTNVDSIADFSADAGDIIQLENAVYTALATAGPLAANAFANAARASTTAQHILYNSLNGYLLYDSDGSGSNAAVLFATLSTGLTLSNTQFVVT